VTPVQNPDPEILHQDPNHIIHTAVAVLSLMHSPEAPNIGPLLVSITEHKS